MFFLNLFYFIINRVSINTCTIHYTVMLVSVLIRFIKNKHKYYTCTVYSSFYHWNVNGYYMIMCIVYFTCTHCNSKFNDKLTMYIYIQCLCEFTKLNMLESCRKPLINIIVTCFTYLLLHVNFCSIRCSAAAWKSSQAFWRFSKQPSLCHCSPYSLLRNMYLQSYTIHYCTCIQCTCTYKGIVKSIIQQ